MSPGTFSDWRLRAKGAARLSYYLGQALMVNVVLGRKKTIEELNIEGLPPPWVALKHLIKLLEEDIQQIQSGAYLAPENFVPPTKQFLFDSLRAFVDLWSVKKRVERGDTTPFEGGVDSKDFPSYFTQNFHYQTDGYLSEGSAELYDHQVETVFVGGADAMRRQCLPPIKQHLDSMDQSTEAPKILDVACGTGRFTHELERNFPKAEVHATDLSPWYLKKASQLCTRTKLFSANAEKLPCDDNSFDVVSCIFLFHELPSKAREAVVREVFRVLKPGGIFIQMDSLQVGDVPELDPSLELFHKLYHEPFYRGYVSSQVSELLEANGFKVFDSKLAFYSKLVVAKKNPV